jgi:uncharacterized membrane protein SirB2
MQRNYLVAIGLYVVATVMTGLPFLGIVQFDLPLSYLTLKLLHLFFVFLILCVLVGQMITYNVMQHAGITSQRALQYLSLLDHTIPVSLILIGVLGHSMATQLGPIWETPWLYEAAFALFAYTAVGLFITLYFRGTGMNLDEESRSSAGVYIGSGSGVVFLLIITGVMVYKQVPIPTAHHLAHITKYFAGAL